MKSKLKYIRRSQRVIRMVSELHQMGYQQLRIMPYLHPLAWRLAVGPIDSFSEVNGASLKEVNGAWDNVPIFSSACSYFEWTDAEKDNARELAEKFVTRFPDVANRGLGRDWAYAGWLSELLGVLEGGDFLPVVEWEFMKGTRDQLRFIPIWSFPDGTTNNVQWDERVHLSEPAEDARQFPLPPAALKPEGISDGKSDD